jgi:hypothetical protein
MKKFFIILFLLLLFSCSDKKSKPTIPVLGGYERLKEIYSLSHYPIHYVIVKDINTNCEYLIVYQDEYGGVTVTKLQQ